MAGAPAAFRSRRRCLAQDDTLKVIDQGADDTTNAVSIRHFFARTAGVRTTTHTAEATVIQTRHRIPEETLRENQIIVYQVPQPEPLYRLEPSRVETKRMHALSDYGLMHVKLYEDVARLGQISISYDYPVMVNQRYLMSPSPIPAFDNPKMNRMPALQLFGAGREKRIYAIPPWTEVRSLDFDDHPFRPINAHQACGLCGATNSYKDEVITDDRGGRMFVCSDTDHCEHGARRASGWTGHDRQPDPRGARAHVVVRRHSGVARCGRRTWSGRNPGDRRRSPAPARPRCSMCCRASCVHKAASSPIAIRRAHAHDVHAMPAPMLRTLQRSDWGFVHQDPRRSLRMNVSAGGNVGERLMAQWRAALRRHPGSGAGLVATGGDRRGPHRRFAADILRRDAAAIANRENFGDASEAGVHG